MIDAAFADGWLQVVPLRETVPREIGAVLHSGEAEAIALAVERHADLVLLDDGDARRLASKMGLHFIGVLGILLRAKQHGGVTALGEEIRRLREEARFFVALKLEMELRIAAGEEPP